MIAIETNLLVFAHRQDSPWHEKSFAAIKRLAEGKPNWAIPWPCVHEFISVATNKRIYVPPSTLLEAVAQVESWIESPNLRLIGEAPDHWPRLKALAIDSGLSGGTVHDARIAAICLEHGVSELWTADRDFSRFPALKTRNPLVG